jgi:hypothetical protein
MKRWIVLLGILALAAVFGGGVPASQAQGGEIGLVVFASDRAGNYDIYLLNPDTGLMNQLTTDPAMDVDPVLSPDGQYIAFASDRDGDFELFQMRVDGTELQQLTRNNAEDRCPRWQPDGDYLIYVSDVSAQWDLYALTLDGLLVRQLTNDPFDERGPGAAAPDAGPQPAPTATPSIVDATVDSYRLNVRANPGEGARIVTTISQGDPVDIIGKRADETWVQVRLTDGQQGWVAAWLLDININLGSIPVVDAPFIAPPPTPTPEPTISPTPQVVIEFWADRTEITSGECATISWRVLNIREVYFQGQGVVGVGSREVCPTSNKTYHLRVVRQDGIVDNRYITIVVNP